MSNRLPGLVILFFCCIQNSKGQSNPDMHIPSTPAFSILGYEPASVMRPTTTKKLSSDLLNSFDKQGRLLMNLGLEVAPYWLKSHPTLRRSEYLNPSTSHQVFRQTFKLSAATVQDSITHENNLGVGFRFQLIKGQLTDEFQKKEAELNSSIKVQNAIAGARALVGISVNTRNDAINSICNSLRLLGVSKANIEKTKAEAVLLSTTFTDTPESIRLFCEKLNERMGDANTELVSNVIALENKRIGLSLEVAGGSKFSTTTGTRTFRKAGFWVNLNNYFTEKDAWTITWRIMTTNSDTLMVNSDIGFGYIREGDDFNFSLEGMLRWYRADVPDINLSGAHILRTDKKFTYRLAAQVAYKISKDISINMSLGKEFDDPVIVKKGFFSILGLNYSIFNKQVVNPTGN